MQLKILAEAADELEQAALWYEHESRDLGVRLIEAFEMHCSYSKRNYHRLCLWAVKLEILEQKDYYYTVFPSPL